jgi:hypothetical protein
MGEVKMNRHDRRNEDSRSRRLTIEGSASYSFIHTCPASLVRHFTCRTCSASVTLTPPYWPCDPIIRSFSAAAASNAPVSSAAVIE